MLRHIASLILILDRLFQGKLIKIPRIKPDKRTLAVFALLKQIYIEAEAQRIEVWVTGSWAVTARAGNFFKNIYDIDLTMRTWEDVQKFEKLLIRLGLQRSGKSPLGANRYIHPETRTTVDFGPLDHPGPHPYVGVQLNENEVVQFRGFKFRALPAEDLFRVYRRILFKKERRVGEDLMKLKILAQIHKEKRKTVTSKRKRPLWFHIT